MTPTQFRAWRKRLGLTQAAAAQALGLSVSRIIDYEQGETRGDKRPAPIPKHVALACAAVAHGLNDDPAQPVDRPPIPAAAARRG